MSNIPRILVIEDDKDYQFILQESLINAGYHVETAETAEEGIEKFYQNPHDLVITDMLFPGGEKGGTEVVLKIKNDFPHAKIIGISAETSTFGISDLESAEVFGANFVLHKPIESQIMLDTVKSVLDGTL